MAAGEGMLSLSPLGQGWREAGHGGGWNCGGSGCSASPAIPGLGPALWRQAQKSTQNAEKPIPQEGQGQVPAVGQCSLRGRDQPCPCAIVRLFLLVFHQKLLFLLPLTSKLRNVMGSKANAR